MQGSEAGFLSMSKAGLGTAGESITALLFWFLLTSIVVAYTSEGGILVSQATKDLLSMDVAPAAGSALFMAMFAALGIFGTESVDLVNRVLVAGLIGSFLGLAGISFPGISTDNLSRSDWLPLYPSVISVGILSFGAQNVIPTLLQYLGGDPIRTQRAVWIGSLIPLLMYSIWEAVFLGVVPFTDTVAGDTGSKMQIVDSLGTYGGVIVKDLVEVFSACAICSSMAGASVSLLDFFQDAILMVREGGKSSIWTSFLPSELSNRLLAAILALAPPFVVSYAFPDAFLGALEAAGLIGGVSLYGLLPALSVLNLRRRQDERISSEKAPQKTAMMPGRLGGGSGTLYFLAIVSTGLILPDVIELAGHSLL